MKYLATCCAVAGLAALSLGLTGHHAARPARAAQRPAAVATGRPARTTPAAHAGARPRPRPPAETVAAPKAAGRAAPHAADAGAAEGLMVGPDGVIYRREAEAR